jgi:hypothetical protein
MITKTEAKLVKAVREAREAFEKSAPDDLKAKLKEYAAARQRLFKYLTS